MSNPLEWELTQKMNYKCENLYLLEARRATKRFLRRWQVRESFLHGLSTVVEFYEKAIEYQDIINKKKMDNINHIRSVREVKLMKARCPYCGEETTKDIKKILRLKDLEESNRKLAEINKKYYETILRLKAIRDEKELKDENTKTP